MFDTETAEQRQRRDASGITVAINVPAFEKARTAVSTAKAANHVDDARLSALAGASATYSAYQALTTDLGVGASLTAGSSSSSSSQTATRSVSKGANIQAGGNVALVATGGGEHSDIDITGSTISAGQNAILAADHDINVRAGENTSSQHSRSKNSGGSIGAVMGSSGTGMQVSATVGSGNSDGTDLTHTSSRISAGNTALLLSGNDTTIIGGQVSVIPSRHRSAMT